LNDVNRKGKNKEEIEDQQSDPEADKAALEGVYQQD
jgi:hypothetical protein